MTSGHSYTSENKKAIYSKILSRKRGITEYILNFCGISSLIPLSVIIIVQYVVVLEMFNQENIDFSLIPWPMSLRSEVSSGITDVVNIKFADAGVFSGSSADWSTFRDSNYLRIKESSKEYDLLFKKF